MVRRLYIVPGHIAAGVKILKCSVLLLGAALLFLLGRGISGLWLEVETQKVSLSSVIRELRVTHSFIGSELSSGKASLAIKAIGEKKIFGELGRFAPTPPPKTSSTKRPMVFKLVGTYLTNKSTGSYAIIEQTQKREQNVFGIGEMVFDEAKLLEIRTDRVFIERDGERSELFLNEGAGESGGDGGGAADRIVISEAEVDEALSNLPMLLTQLRAVPYFKNGEAVGLRLFAIKSGSIFEKIGLKNGDILESINGNQLGDFSQALKIFERLKAERSLKVVLERNRVAMTFNYMIR